MVQGGPELSDHDVPSHRAASSPAQPLRLGQEPSTTVTARGSRGLFTALSAVRMGTAEWEVIPRHPDPLAKTSPAHLSLQGSFHCRTELKARQGKGEASL